MHHKPKLGMFVRYLKIIDTVWKNNISILNNILHILVKGQRYIASACHIISLIEFRKPFTQSKCINCIGIQNNILKKLFHTFIQTVILKLVILNYG